MRIAVATVSGSAIGVYGAHPVHEVDESSPGVDSDFLAKICVDWEAEARKAVQELAALKVDIVKIWVDDRDDMYKKLPPSFSAAIIDEAHKLGETYYWHLFFEKGDVRNLSVALWNSAMIDLSSGEIGRALAAGLKGAQLAREIRAPRFVVYNLGAASVGADSASGCASQRAFSRPSLPRSRCTSACCGG